MTTADVIQYLSDNKNVITCEEFNSIMEALCPYADLQDDGCGQLVVYTGWASNAVRHSNRDKVLNVFDPDADYEDSNE